MKTPREDLDRLFWYGISPRTRVLWLGGILENDHGSDETLQEEAGIYWNTARRIILGLSILDDARGDRPITILMNSCGGDWDHGMAIFDAVQSCRAHVTIINLSHASSMSSVILQSGDLRITAPHGCYMIHDGHEGVHDTPKSVINTVEYSKTHVLPAMYQIYLERVQERDEQAGRPRVDIQEAARILNGKLPVGAERIRPSKGVEGIRMSHIAQLCGQDTYFTPEEMVKLNFADRLLEPGDLAGAYANPRMHGLPVGQASLEDGED